MFCLKTGLKSLIIIFFYVALTGPVFAVEQISSFYSNIKIAEGGDITITETIEYDFGVDERRGIFRDIPVSYQAEQGYRSINLNVVSVKRDNLSEPYEVLREGDNQRIRIGDPDVYISGSHQYELTYKVAGVINYFEDFDELYWNITGNWPVVIKEAGAELSLPAEVDLSQTKSSCYFGLTGANNQCLVSIENNLIVFGPVTNLSPGSGLTIATGFPKGVVPEVSIIYTDEPTAGSPTTDLPRPFNKWVFLFPLFVFVLMLFVWSKYGKDPKGRGTIIAEYEPPKDMKPTFTGLLVDEKLDNRDITAGIIYLAEQGYLKIKRIEKTWFLGSHDYEVILLKNLSDIPTELERKIAEIIFSSSISAGEIVKISSLKRDRQVVGRVSEVRKLATKELVSRGYYVKNPTTVKSVYVSAGAVVLFVPILIWRIPEAIIAGFISIIIVIIFSFFMPKKTKEGALIREHILGFKEFLSLTEADRLKFHNAPEKNPETFMNFLPYAIALGVEKQWAKQFEGIYIENPSWYDGGQAGNFTALSLVNSLGTFTSYASSGFSLAASGSSGSGGGGSVGGGFGGGGGGSW